MRPKARWSPRIEAVGHAVGYWVGGRSSRQAMKVFAEGSRILDLTLGAYAMMGGKSFRLRVGGWVEARGVRSDANVMGFHSPRFGITEMWPEDDQRNVALRQAGRIAGRVDRSPLHRLALRDLQFASRDGTADAFVFAYRAIEDIRQTVYPGEGSDQAWKAMHRRLGTSEAAARELFEIAALARHGRITHTDVQKASRPRRRKELLAIARSVVQAGVADLVGETLQLITESKPI